MTDHTPRVREQAEKASREAYDFNGVRGHDSRNGTRRKAFIAGAVWAAARVTPTRDDIADALAGAYDEWCGLLEEFLAGRGDDPGSEYEYKADAVIALFGEVAG